MARRKSDSPNWGGVREAGSGKNIGRPKLAKGERTTARQISLRSAEWLWLEHAAREYGGSVSKVIRAWVEGQVRPPRG